MGPVWSSTLPFTRKIQSNVIDILFVMNSYPSKHRKRRFFEVTDENRNPNAAKRLNNAEENTKEELGTKPGQNYLSIVLRTKIFGKKGDGKLYKKSFIRKIAVENETYKTMARSDDLFRIEAHMYENLLPLWGNIGPKCIFSQPDEIILEDLGQRQFNTCEIRNFFDLDHCLAVVQTLSSMHSKSLSLKLKEPETFERLIAPLNENIFPADERPSMSIHYENGIGTALTLLQSIQPCVPKVDRAIKFLLHYQNKVVATMKEFLLPRAGTKRYWVITHGDTWKNNIMFNYDNEGKIVNVKFVDFQIARHASAALDFTYFLYTSAQAEVIENHIDDIVAEYERFFLHDLRRCDALESDLKAFSRPGWFTEELQRYGLFGFLGALTTINAIFMDEERAALYEKSKIGDVEIPSGGESSTEKRDRILFMIDHYITHFRKDL
ncbi:uncharacterized protein LOC131671622 isoform X2 [Phymastichus coffea]|uniref:uncharacterized protein LOC131671622 isoform X2 n=1 Tax=Phymastichus coffea TaxID=108790 RepID=UPI00273AC18E|nr:uncharacterized protein LOC131671622 isoform X2 [Phymastichus coffea]